MAPLRLRRILATGTRHPRHCEYGWHCLCRRCRCYRPHRLGTAPRASPSRSLLPRYGRRGTAHDAPVLRHRLLLDSEKGTRRGMGFCEYQDAESAKSAVRHLSGFELNGRKLTVEFALSDTYNRSRAAGASSDTHAVAMARRPCSCVVSTHTPAACAARSGSSCLGRGRGRGPPSRLARRRGRCGQRHAGGGHARRRHGEADADGGAAGGVSGRRAGGADRAGSPRRRHARRVVGRPADAEAPGAARQPIFGPAAAPELAPEIIRNIVGGMNGTALFEVLQQMKARRRRAMRWRARRRQAFPSGRLSSRTTTITTTTTRCRHSYK